MIELPDLVWTYAGTAAFGLNERVDIILEVMSKKVRGAKWSKL